jgi:hypothetical protein
MVVQKELNDSTSRPPYRKAKFSVGIVISSFDPDLRVNFKLENTLDKMDLMLSLSIHFW